MGTPSTLGRKRSISSTILQGVRCHQEEAWERLYQIWQPIVYGWCRKAGLDQDDTEEVVQNVFLRVSRTIHRFQRQSFSGWIHKITENCIIDHCRARRHYPIARGGTGSWVERIQYPWGSEYFQESSVIGDIQPDGSPRACLLQVVHRVLDVIRNDFDERTFRAFWRTTIDECRPVDVAEELNMTPEAVRSATYRVLKRVREELEGMV